jgi:hypothetical protein
MNADRSVLVGVQELLPRRRHQRFALVVLARNGLSSATECLSGTRFPTGSALPAQSAAICGRISPVQSREGSKFRLIGIHSVLLGMRTCWHWSCDDFIVGCL